MHIYFICCYTGEYKENVISVLNNLTNFTNYFTILINQTNTPINLAYNNYQEVVTTKVGASKARNLGIDLSIAQSESLDDLIYFWDEDIYISNEILTNLNKYKLNPKYSAITLKIKGFNGERIGNKLITTKSFSFLNSYRLGNPSFLFKLHKIKIKFDENIGPGKKIIIAAEDTLFIIQNNFFKTICPFEDKYLLHPNATDITTDDKVYSYSVSQGFILKKLTYLDQLIFFIIIIHRPLIGYIFSIKKRGFYIKRIQGIIYGYKKDFNI